MTGARLLGVAAIAFVLAAAAAVWRLPEGAVRYVDVPKVVLPVPRAPPAATALPTVLPERLTAAEPAALIELPRPDPCARPCLALILTGLGLAADQTSRAVALHPAVGLAFSPYATDLGLWAARARAEGHELLLELPLQPVRYPDDDTGPLTLLVAEPAWERASTLADLLQGRDGWTGAVAAAGAFAAEPGAFAPIAAALDAAGLALVELDGAKLAAAARQAGLVYGRAALPPGAGAAAADTALAAAAASARRAGRAILALPPTPAALDRLDAWIAGAAAGTALVPPSDVLGAASQRTAKRP